MRRKKQGPTVLQMCDPISANISNCIRFRFLGHQDAEELELEGPQLLRKMKIYKSVIRHHGTWNHVCEVQHTMKQTTKVARVSTKKIITITEVF